MAEIQLNYSVPISEKAQVEKDFIIKGIAIHAKTTENNHKFLPEELKLSAMTLKGVPLLIDHRNEISAIKGRVTESAFDEINANIPFSAKVMDAEIRSMIEDGRINSVSIGATAKELVEEDDVLIPKGIVFKELSLVAVPADPQATFDMALREAYIQTKVKGGTNKKDSMKEDNKIKENEEATEEPAKTEDKPEEEAETEEAESTSEDTQENADVSELKKKVAMLEKELKTLKEEEDKSETKSEEPEDKTEEPEDEEEEEVTEEKSGYQIKQDTGSLRGDAFYIVRL